MINPSKNKILIVDDDEDFCEVLNDRLVGKGWDTRLTHSGVEALNLILEGNWIPNIILSDVRMPQMDGVEFLQRLRERELEIPVIIMTGFAQKEQLRQSWRAGFTDYIEKPFSPQKLDETLAIALELDPEGEGERFSKLSKQLFCDVVLKIDRSLFEELDREATAQHRSLNTYLIELIKKARQENS